MGCGNAQEKLENQIMEMNIDKIEIQMERYRQMQLLGKDSTTMNKTKNLKRNTVNNNNINMTNKNNANIKRKTAVFQASKQNLAMKTGKGRRSKCLKTVRVNNNINNAQ